MPTPRVQTYEVTTERVEMPLVRDIELTHEDVVRMGERIASITLQPDSVVLRVGQMFLMRQVRVMARDSTSAPVGRVYSVSWRYTPGAIITRADTVVGSQPGRSEMLFRLTPNESRTAVLRVIVVP